MFFLKTSLLNLGDFAIKTNVNIFGFETVIKNHGLMKIIFEYLGFIIFGIIFYQKFEGRSFFIKNEEEEEEQVKNKLLYNDIKQEEGKNLRASKLMLVACGSFAIQLIIRSILYFCMLSMFDM